MKKDNTTVFLAGNILIPLVLGAIIYYVTSPNVIFVKYIDAFFGNSTHISVLGRNQWLMRFVRNYLLDMMWSYALVFTLFSTMGNSTAELRNIWVIAFAFSALMEILQLTPKVNGTFDVFDILVEALAEVAAVFIIYIKYSIIEEVQKEI